MIVGHILKGLMKGVFPCFGVFWQNVNNSFLTTPFSFETGKVSSWENKAYVFTNTL